MNKYKLAFVIPAFNEEKSLGNIVTTLVTKGTVIVVDDCSHDQTYQIAESCGARVVRHSVNMGYSKSLNTGFNEAFRVLKMDGVITVDADGEHKLESVEKVIDLLVQKKSMLVLGARDKKNRNVEYLIGFLIKKLFGISDIFCGLRGYQSVLFSKKKDFDENDTVGTEFVIACLKGKVPFKEIPIETSKRKGSSRFGADIKASFYLIKGIFRALSVKPIFVFNDSNE
jgi:glycosyltransferase involved in cell wall biosynthesis